jgi:arginase
MIEVFVVRQWQGAGERYDLLTSLDSFLSSSMLRYTEVPTNLLPSETINGIRHYASIKENLGKQMKTYADVSPDRALTLACECSGGIAPISYFISNYPEDMVVLWIDAHGDMNTPESSPSGNFHGMPLRVLLGDGPIEIVRQVHGKLIPERVGLVGVRDLDRPEQTYISENEIRHWPELDITATEELLDFISGRKVYVHLDLDVIDPESASLALYKTPGGISIEALMSLIEEVSKVATIVGTCIAEYNELGKKEMKVYGEIVKRCLEAMERVV